MSCSPEYAGQLSSINRQGFRDHRSSAVLSKGRGWTRSGPFYDGNRLELLKVDVEVDDILKGHYADRRLIFYRYDCAVYCRDAHPTLIQAGHRYVFMLVDTGNRLRSTRDVVGSFFSVSQTADPSLSASRDPAYLVAQSVLQPARDHETVDWTRSLFRRSAVSTDLVGLAQTIRFLAPLLDHPSADLRREACFLLADAMHDYRGCLSHIVSDPSENEIVRYRARQRIEGLEAMQKELHSTFLSDPLRWVEAMAGGNPKEMKDRLSLLSGHPDMVVRKALRVFFRTSEQCRRR